MLNPLTRWEPGTPVRYHGSLASLHGVYRAYPCACLGCRSDHTGPVRFSLHDPATGAVAASHVRPTSITPA